jgi:Protein of unknown function (DUF3093)
MKYRVDMKRKGDFGTPEYSETIRPPWWLWLIVLLIAATFSLAIWAALGIWITLAFSIGELLLITYAALTLTLNIEVTKGWLIVGNAAIERAYIHNFLPLGKREMRLARGQRLDPAAYLAIRFWLNTGVKIDLRDPKDPTPYWLVSSRKPEILQRALLAH